ncbi:hypothetical protein [Streptomyces sp. AcH 505]|uniref:hypothetical protein n=1 Tax=Streptomyces sp. AcH 505 TaxID=352211 RepID=UPI000AA5579F
MPEMSRERLAEVKALRSSSPPEDLWFALRDLLRDREHLVEANTEAATELADWTGTLR